MTNSLIKDRYLVQRIEVELDYVTRSVCVDTILGREVLLTQLQGRIGRQAAVQQRFQDEARIAARLSHGHIVALYDTDTWNGLPIAVQEHAQSETLRDVINHEGPFHPDDVAVLVEHIAEALDFADQRGMHHLALRPDVIVVDYDGQALVADFGLGRILDDLAGTTAEVMRYRAPEQLADQTAGHAADIYALGVIAYEMLTGLVPFASATVEEHRDHITAGPPLAPSRVRPEVPPTVGEIVLRALSLEPERRYPTASAFADALVNWRGSIRSTRPHAVSAYSSGDEYAETAFVPLASSPETSNASSETRSRLVAAMAWAGVAIGVIALAWVAYQLLRDDDGGPARTPTQIAVEFPTASAVIEPTSPTGSGESMPTAVSLIGMTLEQAEAISEVRVRTEEDEPSDTVPAGQITRQSPEPGQPVTSGEIVVAISSGQAEIDLAQLDLEGRTFDAAAKQLTTAGLNVIRVDEGNSSIAANRVVRTEEATARPGDTIRVVVSMGNQLQIPQDAFSKPIAEVTAILDDMGFDVADPIAVSEETIRSAQVDLAEFDIVDGDLVGFREDGAGFGAWIPAGDTITPVVFDESL